MIPRMMKRATAAAYCDLSVAAFEREVNRSKLGKAAILKWEKHRKVTLA